MARPALRHLLGGGPRGSPRRAHLQVRPPQTGPHGRLAHPALVRRRRPGARRITSRTGTHPALYEHRLARLDRWARPGELPSRPATGGELARRIARGEGLPARKCRRREDARPSEWNEDRGGSRPGRCGALAAARGGVGGRAGGALPRRRGPGSEVAGAPVAAPGLYRVEVQPERGPIREEPGLEFVGRLDPRESDLRRVAEDELMAQLGGSGSAQVASSALAAEGIRGTPLWSGLLLLGVLAILGEGALT